MKRPLKVFLYHAPGDKTAVRDLYLRLIKDGADACLVKDKLLPGQDWQHEIRKAVREADAVVVCVSQRFDQSEFGQKEMRVAFDVATQELDGQLFILSARLEECDTLEMLGKWQPVDLFEADGYENLIQVLEARADQTGATIQRKDGSLPELRAAGVKDEQSVLAEEPVAVMPGILAETAQGILIEGSDVQLPRSGSRHRRGSAMMFALMGLVGIVAVAMLSPARLERWYQVALEVRSKLTQTPAPGTEISPVVVSRLRPIPPLARKGKISHIAFLVDTSSSMLGQRQRMVKSAASKFVSRLGGDYRVSVLEFDTNVELRLASTHDYADASEVIRSITLDVTANGTCVRDALYAGVEQTFTSNVNASMIIVLTDVILGENVGRNCSIRFMEDFFNLTWDRPVPIFFIYVGENFNENSFAGWMGMEGAALAAESEKDIESALLSISKAAGLELNAESMTPTPLPADSAAVGQAPMVFVPPGEFIMGNSNSVGLDAFWIDKTEVTNAMYARCVQAGTCNPPSSNRSATRSNYFGGPPFVDYPVIFVSWTDANTYCSWVGGRLPTEAEWEKAARGTDGRQFPWGNAAPFVLGSQAHFGAEDTVDVGSYPENVSPYGALDMAGNVAEWVADWLSVEYYNDPPASNPLGPDSGQYRVWRGGSWANTSADSISTYSRTGNLPTDSSSGIGFRCARDAAP